MCLLSKGIITALSIAQMCEYIVHSGTVEGSGGFHTVVLCCKSICWFPLGCFVFTKPYCKAGQGTHPYGAFPTALTSHANWLRFASWDHPMRKVKASSTLRLCTDAHWHFIFWILFPDARQLKQKLTCIRLCEQLMCNLQHLLLGRAFEGYYFWPHS